MLFLSSFDNLQLDACIVFFKKGFDNLGQDMIIWLGV